MGMFKVRVAEVLDQTHNIKSFRLQRPDGAPFDPYPAGAHIDIVGPTAVVRQYSLCSPPDSAEDYVIAVKLEPESRGGSAALHDQVTIGQELEISAPRNLLAVAPHADRHILVAAGIGVTPMISIAYHLHRAGQEFDLHYFAGHAERRPSVICSAKTAVSVNAFISISASAAMTSLPLWTKHSSASHLVRMFTRADRKAS